MIEVFTRATQTLKVVGHEEVLNGAAQHLAAVSYARLGNQKEALRLWKEARRHAPSLDIIRQNMTDAKRPVGERNGAWPFAINQWFAHMWVERLERAFAVGMKRGDLAAKREVEKVLKSVPRT